mmetsp:Transcript_8095/g.24486  ORF Transcript_8095/g.24486 Transcript_8095/m.24486 type:complete len:215 (+) Transcript_8095:361-1005(+)
MRSLCRIANLPTIGLPKRLTASPRAEALPLQASGPNPLQPCACCLRCVCHGAAQPGPLCRPRCLANPSHEWDTEQQQGQNGGQPPTQPLQLVLLLLLLLRAQLPTLSCTRCRKLVHASLLDFLVGGLHRLLNVHRFLTYRGFFIPLAAVRLLILAASRTLLLDALRDRLWLLCALCVLCDLLLLLLPLLLHPSPTSATPRTTESRAKPAEALGC